MVMRRLTVLSAAWLAGWFAIIGTALPGCGVNASEFESWLSEVAGSTKTLTYQETVAIRIVNQTSAVLMLDVLLDNQMQTFNCTSQGICEFPLASCPEVIEAVSERRFDTRGTFIGGRDFTGADAFRLTRDDFQCNETIMFIMSESDTEVMVL